MPETVPRIEPIIAANVVTEGPDIGRSLNTPLTHAAALDAHVHFDKVHAAVAGVQYETTSARLGEIAGAHLEAAFNAAETAFPGLATAQYIRLQEQAAAESEEYANGRWLDDDAPLTAEQAAFLRDSRMVLFGIDPDESASYLTSNVEEPVTQADYDAWARQQNPELLTQIQSEKDQRLADQELQALVHEKLTRTVPELYRAKLPLPLAEKLGDTPYAIGFTQWNTRSIDEAVAQLKEYQGINITDHAYFNRANIFDSGSIQHGGELSLELAIDSGYYRRSEIGRFVTAFPAFNLTTGSQNLSKLMSFDNETLPDDFEARSSSSGPESSAISTEYVAGYIDNNGDFWKNDNFMINTTPAFTHYEPSEANWL